MGYVGTTAASSVQNPPIRIGGGLAGGILGSTVNGASLWLYNTTDLSSVLSTASYFTDGLYLGMRIGDIVIGCAGGSIGSTLQFTYMGAIMTATTAGCALSTAATQTSSQ